MSELYQWRLVPAGLPTIIRCCPKCGNKCEYECSGKFRVNANQNLIDVWLIYQCRKCKNTWNLEILSRVNSNSIDKEHYLKFLHNDDELARQYAYNISLHSRNKSVLCFDSVTYEIAGDYISFPSGNNSIQIEFICDYPLDIRIDKILSQKLGISREQVKKLCDCGKITVDGMNCIKKAKAKSRMLISLGG